jgi:hypothetical protein
MQDDKGLPDDSLLAQALKDGAEREKYNDSFYDIVATAIMKWGAISETTFLDDFLAPGQIQRYIGGGTAQEIQDEIDKLIENGDVIKACNDKYCGYYLSKEKQEELRAIIRERKQQR